MIAYWLNVFGLSCNIIGTIILAVSLNKYIRSIRQAIDAHEVFINSLTENPNGGRPIIQITGLNRHLNSGRDQSNAYLKAGIVLVVIGFIGQLTSYILSQS